MKRVPASLAVLLLHQEADASGDERLRIRPATLRKWVERGHITRGDGGYDLAEILTYLEQRERSTSVDELAAWLLDRYDEEQAELDPYLRDPYEGATDDERHQRHAHPNYEYKTTEGQRKAWPYVDDPPEGDGWELNKTSVDPDAFERFEYTEERYWRRLRLRSEGPQSWVPAREYTRRADDLKAKRRIVAECRKEVERETASTAWALAVTTLRLLALPYSDRPGYREEAWRP